MSAPKGIVPALLPAIDSILSIRDSIGALIEPMFLVTRTWSGAEPGAGTASDNVVQLLPTPAMKNFSQDVRLREGGAVKAGDIILKGISKNKFDLAELDGTSPGLNVEKFYRIGVKLYTVINVTENYVTWDVQLRELTNQ